MPTPGGVPVVRRRSVRTDLEAEFNKECGSLAALLDPLIKSLASETSQLVNMHASRSK